MMLATSTFPFPYLWLPLQLLALGLLPFGRRPDFLTVRWLASARKSIGVKTLSLPLQCILTSIFPALFWVTVMAFCLSRRLGIFRDVATPAYRPSAPRGQIVSSRTDCRQSLHPLRGLGLRHTLAAGMV